MSRAAQARLRCTAHALIKQTDSSTDAAGTQPRETEAEAGDGALKLHALHLEWARQRRYPVLPEVFLLPTTGSYRRLADLVRLTRQGKGPRSR